MDAVSFTLRAVTWPLRFLGRLVLLAGGLILPFAAYGVADTSLFAAIGYLIVAGFCWTAREALV